MSVEIPKWLKGYELASKYASKIICKGWWILTAWLRAGAGGGVYLLCLFIAEHKVVDYWVTQTNSNRNLDFCNSFKILFCTILNAIFFTTPWTSCPEKALPFQVNYLNSIQLFNPSLNRQKLYPKRKTARL